jgi:hypothetical protein
LDFLGFKQVIAETESNPDRLNDLLLAIKVAGEIEDEDDNGSQQVTQFSDSIVVSYRWTRPQRCSGWCGGWPWWLSGSLGGATLSGALSR